jgi:hypothetical protein
LAFRVIQITWDTSVSAALIDAWVIDFTTRRVGGALALGVANIFHCEGRAGFISGLARVTDLSAGLVLARVIDFTTRRVGGALALGVANIFHCEGRAGFISGLARVTDLSASLVLAGA